MTISPKMLVPFLGVLLLPVFMPVTAMAACAPGDAGKIRYNEDHSVMEYCNATNWVSMSKGVGAGGGLNSGLIAHWQLDEASGSLTAADDTVNAHTATLMNMDTAAAWTTGMIAGGLNFDGVDDYASVSGAIEGFPMTISSWFKGTNFSIGNYSDQAVGVSIFNSSGTCLTANYMNTFANRVYDETNFCIPASQVYDNQWHLITFVVDAAGGRLYLDGVLQSTRAWDGTPSAYTQWHTQPFYIGGSGYYMNSQNRRTQGLMDDVRVYNRALSLDEIKALYSYQAPGSIMYNKDNHLMQFVSDKGVHAMGPAGPEPSGNSVISGLVGYWRFNETAGLSAPNTGSGGAALNGTLTNMNNADWVAGKYGNALLFNGSNKYVNLPDTAAFDLTNAGSWCLWFNSTANHTGAGLFAHGGATYAWIGAYITAASGRLAAYVRTSGVAHVAQTADMGTGYWNNKWHHVCSTFDRTLPDRRLKLYINGILSVETDAQNANIDAAAGPRIGNWGSNSIYFAGRIDDVRMYNRALSAMEVRVVMELSSCSSPTAPEGAMVYNADHNIMQYCNGTEWVAAGK